MTQLTHISDSTPSEGDLPAWNDRWRTFSAEERVGDAAERLGAGLVLSSSFGIQAAVMLHLATRVVPSIPVIVVDTGYLFPETYRFIDTLVARLDLNLHVARAEISPAWLEARHGQLWTRGPDALRQYNDLVKVRPMKQALDRLGATGWLAGLRRQQAGTRRELPFVGIQDGRWKFAPIADWSTHEVHAYLAAHALPTHPLFEKGYVSIGDTHSTVPLGDGMTEEQTRFGGQFRECGLHSH